MKHFIDWIAAGILILLIPSTLFAVSIGKSGERDIGVLETIHGIPYPIHDESIVILEDMAHADLFLKESVFAKRAHVTVTFDPKNATSIDLGIRENEFWLSYVRYPLYQKGVDTPGFQTKEILIPLTRMIQDTDRSVDLMFFTEGSLNWRIHAFRASLESDMPTFQEAKSYIKSVLIRERAL